MIRWRTVRSRQSAVSTQQVAVGKSESSSEQEQREFAANPLLPADRLPPTARWTPIWLVVILASAPLGVFEFVLPLFGTALGASTTTIGWLFSVFSLTALALRPLIGYVLDLGRQGVRRWWVLPPMGLLACGLVVYAISMGLFAIAGSVATLVIARLVQGVASTITWLTVNVVLADRSDPGERARAFGLLTSLSVIGSSLGATWTVIIVALFDATTRAQVTQFLPELARWSGLPLDQFVFPTPILHAVATLHIVFWGYVGFVLLALLALAGRRPETRDKEAGRSVSNDHVASSSASPPLSASRVSRLLSQLLPLTPLLPLLLASLLRSGGYGLTLPVLTVYLNERFGAGLVGVGLAFALPGIVYAIAPGPLGRLADRIGHQRAAVAGLLTSVITYGLLPLLPNLLLLVPLWMLEALCFCLAGPALSALLADRAPQQLRGRAFALYSLAGGIGAALTPALGGWMYERFGAAWPFWSNGLLVALAALAVAYPVAKRPENAPA